MKAARLAPLRHRTFRLLFGGQLISDLGDWLDFLALIALISAWWYAACCRPSQRRQQQSRPQCSPVRSKVSSVGKR